MVAFGKKLLIVPCSKSKRSVPEAEAIEVYDGPYYKMLRKTNLNSIDVLILSAKYGLIDHKTKISPYDQKMTVKRAKEMRNSVTKQLDEFLNQNSYNEVVINLGRIYIQALDIQNLEKHNIPIKVLTGDIIKRVSTFKTWLITNSGDRA
jgi:cytoplasmic iron level regulating protein YaaA (DUF328/UPF0246 family)